MSIAESRALPNNIEAEQALLGAILVNNQALGFVTDLLTEDHFYEPLHGKIFNAVRDCVAEGKPATPLTLKDALPADLDVGGGLTVSMYLARLCAEATTVINATSYAEQIRDLATMRAMIGVSHDLAEARANFTAPAAALSAAFSRVDELRMIASGSGAGHRAMLATHTQALMQEEVDSFHVTSGLADLDRATGGGYRGGRLVIVAGRPGMGKTVFLCSSARRVARAGVGVSLFSHEVDGRELSARFVSDELARTHWPVAYRDIVASRLDEADAKRVFGAAQNVFELPIMIDDSSALSMSDIEARARLDRDRFAKKGIRLGMVGIDYLGLVKCSDRYQGRKVDELGEVVLAAKNMAKRLDVCVVLLAQLSRAVEQREDKRPHIADLRDSGNIEEHADIVCLLYRSAYYIERNEKYRAGDPEMLELYARNRNRMEFLIGKNRLGPCITIDMWCDPALSAVDNGDWSR